MATHGKMAEQSLRCQTIRDLILSPDPGLIRCIVRERDLDDNDLFDLSRSSGKAVESNTYPFTFFVSGLCTMIAAMRMSKA